MAGSRSTCVSRACVGREQGLCRQSCVCGRLAGSLRYGALCRCQEDKIAKRSDGGVPILGAELVRRDASLRQRRILLTCGTCLEKCTNQDTFRLARDETEGPPCQGPVESHRWRN